MLYDPDRVGGLPATDGLSGVRPDAPAPQGAVEGTDGGGDDRLALLAVNDIQSFWTADLPSIFSGRLHACLVHQILRFDKSVKRAGLRQKTVIYGDPNASYCSSR